MGVDVMGWVLVGLFVVVFGFGFDCVGCRFCRVCWIVVGMR